MVNRASNMRRAWSLLRQSMAPPYSRAAFAACLRRAWHGGKNAPVPPISAIRTVMGYSERITRDELIERLEVALRAARVKSALYRRAGRRANWSGEVSVGGHLSCGAARVHLEARDRCAGRKAAFHLSAGARSPAATHRDFKPTFRTETDMTTRNVKAAASVQWLRVFSLSAPAPADATAEEREMHEQRRARLAEVTAGG